jgi:serine/threonine protein kinase
METRWGKRFGRYEIVAELGRGGMGIVYKARDPKIDRFVAVKTICLVGQVPEEQVEYRERFFQEAQAAGRLLHPGIVTIFDVGEDPESRDPYIVMEYVAGVPLNGMLAEGQPIPLPTALRLTQQLAEALDCAHAQGIVHRDIKPANIMVTAAGQAKITDFGIAKLSLTHLTMPGHAFGTPAYISPEQLNGDPVDGRADIFSLGVVLYSMVTGYRPFQGNSVATVCFKVVNREPLPPTALDPALPRELDAVLARAIAKNPADRYQRGMELALDLGELLEGRGPASKVNARSTQGRIPPSDPDSKLARSLLSRAMGLPSTRVITVCGCMAVLALLVLFRPASIGRSTTVDLPEVAGKPGANPSGTFPADGPVSPRATAQDSILDIQIDHHFTAGSVSVWVDGDLEYSHSLRSETKKRFLLFHSSQGRESKKLSLTAGEHQVRVRAQSYGNGYDQHKELSGVFASGSERTLFISFDGLRKGMRVALKSTETYRDPWRRYSLAYRPARRAVVWRRPLEGVPEFGIQAFAVPTSRDDITPSESA